MFGGFGEANYSFRFSYWLTLNIATNETGKESSYNWISCIIEDKKFVPSMKFLKHLGLLFYIF